jgi:iron complex outermembrane receptor protein
MSRLQKHVAAVIALAITAPGLVYAADEALQEVTITGSRIASKTGMDTPTPVTAVSSAELTRMAPGGVIDALSQLPQFFGDIGPEQIIGGQNSGGANVNLRGAGVNRTLVLLDGRRVVSSNRFGTVDVNMFPKALLKGIETVTGGASASYGTDAVAGVVNFLLDTDLEGIKAHVQGGETTRSDGRNWEGSLALGHSFGEKLHVIGAFGIDNLDPIDSFSSLKDRGYFNQAARVTNPDTSPNTPAEIIRPYVTPTNFTNGGIIVDAPPANGSLPGLAALNRLQFLPDGTVSPLPFSGVGNLNAGCQCMATPTETYGVDADTEVASGYRRNNAFLRADYDFTDSTKVFLQGLHGETRTSDRRESVSLLSVWQARIYADNAYLPASVRQLIQTNLPANRQYVGFGMFALDQPGTPLGESRHFTDNHTDAATLGFKTELGSGWKLDGYYQYGENRQDFVIQNGIRVDRLPMALDAVRDNTNGNIVCRVSLPQFDPTGIFKGCVPVNLFGGLQNVTPEAAAWIVDQNGKIARQWTDQQSAELVLTGDVWKGFGAGPIAAAFGASYRKDRLSQRTVDPSDEFPALPDGTLLSSLGIAPAGIRGVIPQGNTSVPGYNGIPGLRFVPGGFLGDSNSSSVLFSSLRAISGAYNVKEAFTEFQIPLLRDVAWARNLELSTAGRWASYSGSGSIWAWKGGLSWSINDQIRLRVTQSRDVRAATLQERFDQTRGGVNVTDPANGNQLVTTASFSGGNPNVTPEKADTTTIGVVFRPAFLAGFSMSVDWYSIDIADAIGQLTSQNVVTACFRGDQTLCQYVHRRDGAQNGIIDRVDNLFINLANQRISGIDLETSYRRDIKLFGGGPESIIWRFYGTNLRENSIQNKGAARDERAGQVGPGVLGAGALPKYKFTTNLTYSDGPFSVFLQGRWIDGGLLDRLVVESQTAKSVMINGVAVPTIDDNTVPSTFYMDLNLSYTTGKNDNLDAYFNVTNLLDRAPAYAPSVIGRAGTVEFNTSLSDLAGRRFVVGLNYKF